MPIHAHTQAHTQRPACVHIIFYAVFSFKRAWLQYLTIYRVIKYENMHEIKSENYKLKVKIRCSLYRSLWFS